PDDADAGAWVETAREHRRQLRDDLREREREVLGEVGSAGVAAAPGQPDLQTVGCPCDGTLAEADPADVDGRVAVETEDAADVLERAEVHQPRGTPGHD